MAVRPQYVLRHLFTEAVLAAPESGLPVLEIACRAPCVFLTGVGTALRHGVVAGFWRRSADFRAILGEQVEAFDRGSG